MSNRIAKGLTTLWERLTKQGLLTTALWAADHAVRATTGAPIRCLSQITPYLHVGGQYRQRGWPALTQRGITAVIDMRIEFDDRKAGIAPGTYLYLPVIDDEAPSLHHLSAGVKFMTEVISSGGAVYIHCGAGVGRAPTMAAAYLVSTGMAPTQALEMIQARRPFIRPKPAQVAQIEMFAKHTHPSSLTPAANQ